MANVKVHTFRNKFERDLRKIIPVACAIATCTNDGDSETEEAEMNALAAIVLDISERAKKIRKPREAPESTISYPRLERALSKL
jgi:hypothetical protein